MNSESSTTRPRGRRPTLSLEAVVDAAVGLLDESGQSALTFRALAARMGTGVGAIYHYISGRDELLDRATDAVLAEILEQLVLPEEPFEALRTLSMVLYDSMQAHTWAASYFMRNATMQPAAIRIFELLGQQFLRMPMTATQRFDAASSLVSFVVGTGAEMRELPAEMLEDDKSQQEHLQDFADAWRQLDPTEFPFMHSILDGFAEHDDRMQFQVGVDIFLAGVRAQFPSNS